MTGETAIREGTSASDEPFRTCFRVRYAEIDGQKVVFNSRYLEYADVAVTEYWRWARMNELPEWRALEFHVVRALVDFKLPFRLDDMVLATARTSHIGRSSMSTTIELRHGETGALHTVVELVNVNVDLKTGQSAAIPDAVRQRLTALAR